MPDDIDTIELVDDYRIGRVRIEPGECLVVKSHVPVTRQYADQIKRHIAGIIGEVPVIVIGPEIDLAVIAGPPPEIDNRPAHPIKRVIELPAE